MLDRLERMCNRLSDMDWTWGPLLSLRPAKNVKMNRRYYLRFILPAILLGAIALDLLLTLSELFRVGALHSSSLFLSYFLPTFSWYALRYTFLYILVCIVLIAPVLWAWNHRADRLQHEPEPIPELSSVVNPEGVWPPAPRR